MTKYSNLVQNDLCKGLRACGIPKKQTHEILNIVRKWLDSNGPEWTNSRIKDLRQWYETSLTGDPVTPKWFKHSKENMPLGIWAWVFKLPTAKALGVLSLNTVLYEKEFSETQKEKFLHGLAGNGTQDQDKLEECIVFTERLRLPKRMPEIQFPTLFDMTGSIPVHEGRSTVRPNGTLGGALKALRESWKSVPQVTFDFLDRQDLLSYMPMSTLGNAYSLELNRPHDRCVGRVSVLQQPQLKARVIGNPNRVLQATLEPLKELYMSSLRKLPTDVTHDQESGVAWVQDMLKQEIELAGSDLTSASDLLDIRLSLDLVDRVFGFPRVHGYKEYREYFFEVSRSWWYCPSLNQEVQWKQGDVLGTGPSFGLLSLTNNAVAMQAWKLAVRDRKLDPSISWKDSFRVVGDDIVMRAELSSYYNEIICALGGEINLSKSITSNRVAEFAGKVITSECHYLKAIKYSEPSDNSFMSYMSQLGDQAKYLLKPKQRKVYRLLKEVPGILIYGPWMKDSYGIALGPRYAWYLEEVEPALTAAEPDLKLEDYALVLLKAELSLQEAGEFIDDHQSFDEPFNAEGYLPSVVTPSFKVGGDPRLTNGKTLLDILYQHIRTKDITPFEEWYKNRYSPTSLEEEEIDLDSLVDTPVQSIDLETISKDDAARVVDLMKLIDEDLRFVESDLEHVSQQARESIPDMDDLEPVDFEF